MLGETELLQGPMVAMIASTCTNWVAATIQMISLTSSPSYHDATMHHQFQDLSRCLLTLSLYFGSTLSSNGLLVSRSAQLN